MAAGVFLGVAVSLVVVRWPLLASAGGGITPGLAAGGVPLSADVAAVNRILGRPTDEGAVCPGMGDQYMVDGRGASVSFRSTREDVKRAFGYRPERALHDPHFTILVYESAGVAFYIREGGARNGLVDVITVFPKESSTSVWTPASCGHR